MRIPSTQYIMSRYQLKKKTAKLQGILKEKKKAEFKQTNQMSERDLDIATMLKLSNEEL